jgi:hypothetical protein
VTLLSADKLHHSSCQVVHRAGDLDASFLSQFIKIGLRRRISAIPSTTLVRATAST